MRTALISLAILGLLAAVGLAQENPRPPEDPRDAHLAAMAQDLVEKAELALKIHRLEEAQEALERVQAMKLTGPIAHRALLLHVDLLVRKGAPEAALELLERLQSMPGVLPDVTFERAVSAKAAIQAMLEARMRRQMALEMRLNAARSVLEAEKAEARAHLVRQGVAADEIERHLGEIVARHAIEMARLEADLEAFQRGRYRAERPDEARPDPLRRRHEEARDAYRQARGRHAEVERLVAEALKRFEEIHREFVKAHPIDLGGNPEASRLRMMHDVEKLLRDLIHQGVQPPGRENVDRARAAYRGALESLRRSGNGPRDEREGREERPGRQIQERLTRLEQQMAEMRALLEEALRDR